MVVREQREKIQNGQKGIRGLKARMGRSAALVEGARLNSGGIQVGGSHSVTSRDAAGAAPAVRAAKSSEFGEGE